MVESFMLWVLVLASYMSLIPICTCQDGVFRVPLTLKHNYNVTTTQHPLLLTASEVSVETTRLFTGQIVLGGQQFDVVFDTGSDDLWVYGNDVNKENFGEDGHDHHYYNNVEESSTGEPFKQSYGSEEFSTKVTGVQALDTLNIGQIEVNPCRFAVINQLETGGFVNTRYDGIMGLGFHEQSFFTSMVRQGALHFPMFSVYMAKDSSRGEILFGSWDERYFKYPYEANVVQTTDYWSISVSRLGLGDRYLETPEEILLAVVDTGGEYFHIPPKLIDAARQDSETLDHALNRDSGTYGYVPCSSRSSLPTLKITMGTWTYVLTGEEYTTTVGATRGRSGQLWCPLEMDDLVPAEKLIVIGVPFFRKYYTMFFHEYDGYEGPVVAFAEAKHPSS